MRDNLLLLCSVYDYHKTDELKIIRNKLKCKYQSAIKLAKIAAHDKIILNSSNKQKSMWSLINKNRNPKNSLIFRISPNNFNNYFCSVSDTIIKQMGVSEKTFCDVFKKKISLKQKFSRISKHPHPRAIFRITTTLPSILYLANHAFRMRHHDTKTPILRG